jgi:hypothetical protein
MSFKRFTIALFFLLFTNQSFSQYGFFSKNPLLNHENWDKQRVHYGYFLGFNMMDFKIDYIDPQQKEIEVLDGFGFNLGIVGNLRIFDNLDLRFEPGFYYTQRNLMFPGFDQNFKSFRETNASYLHFPLLLKFSSQRIGNFRPYLVAGGSFTYNLASNHKVLEDLSNNIFRVQPFFSSLELGFGVDFYLPYFKFSPSIRGLFSGTDELIRDKDPQSPYTSNILGMSTRAILINFTFH